MAAGAQTIISAQSQSQYIGQNAALDGQAFDTILQFSMSNSDILSDLQGGPGSNKPFTLKTQAGAGGMAIINFPVGTDLGQTGRRGSVLAINYEEPLIQNSWSVTIDSLRVVVGWNDIVATVATTGKTWKEVYPELCGKRVGQIEQEDLLMRMRQRSSARNTVRPSNRANLNAITYSDLLDASTLGRAILTLTSNGAAPAMIGKEKESGMPIEKFVALGPQFAWEGLWSDVTFTTAITYSDVRGDENVWFTGELPEWRGTVLKRWDIKNHDNPGPIGSSVMPQAILGDAYSGGYSGTSISSGGNAITGTPTVAITIYGSGRTQATLNGLNANGASAIYAPFELFYGVNKPFTGSQNYYPTSNPTDQLYTTTGTTTSASTTLTATAPASVIGFSVTGPGIVNGTTITAQGATTMTLSAAASTGYGTGPVTFTPVYYFVIIDPADGFWNLYSYSVNGDNGGPGGIAGGYGITWINNLAASVSGTAVTTLGSATFNSAINKEVFPIGALIFQCNSRVVPVCDVYVFGKEAGGKAYGMYKNKRITQLNDYGALTGFGVWSIYGNDMRVDTQGNYWRNFVRIQCAYEIPGFSLPQY